MNNLFTFEEFIKEGLISKTIMRDKSNKKRMEDLYTIDDIRTWVKDCVDHVSYNQFGVDKELTKKLDKKSYWVIFNEDVVFKSDIPDNVNIKAITGAKKYGRLYIGAYNITSLNKLPKKIGSERNDIISLNITLNNIKDSIITIPEGVTYLRIKEDDDITRLPKELNCSISLTNPKQFNHIEKVNGDFSCGNSPSITSLVGCPKEITGIFDAHFNGIVDLVGCPKHVKTFTCSNNGKLKSLKGCGDTIIDDDFKFYSTGITNIDEFPKHVGGNVEMSGCTHLENFVGLPEIINGSLDISYCNVQSLDGLPKEVKGFVIIKNLTLNNETVNVEDIKKIRPDYKIKLDIYSSDVY